MAAKHSDPFYATNYTFKSMRAIKDRVVVEELDASERFSNAGILILSDNGKESGIRPRWGRVYAIGPEQNAVSIGQWVLVEHARWTRGLRITDDTGPHLIRMVEPNAIMVVSDDKPQPDDM